ncbi:MAG: CotH kinase family protein [Flavobacteriales bacterium]|nr:CotH kinase family protein [Flavobacteriales bacterium]
MKKKIIILVVGVALILGFLALDKVAVIFGYSGGVELATQVSGNYLSSDLSMAVSFQLVLDETSLKLIEEKRDKAIKRGFLFNEADSYVPMKLICNEDTLTGEMRLKGHMLDHLEGEKWSYRVKLDGNQRFMGMKRFSLQHPGTRNYIYEWAFHEMLKREDIIALNYDFVNVTLNDRKLGVYALEEHFAEELLEHNNRPAAAILRFNPKLYWIRREKMDLDGEMPFEQYSRYRCAYLEPYDRGRVLKDSVLMSNFLKAQYQLESFRAGVLSTSQVFDIEKLACYHAILDLVGGHHSIDWSDIKYVLNDSTGKIEPVGYESFGVRKSIYLCGTNKYDSRKSRLANFHKTMFSDPVFFREYIKQVKRISNKSYIDEFLASITETIKIKSRILHAEFPYKEFSPQGYYENQKFMAQQLNVPKGFHGYFSALNEDSIMIQIGAINVFPIEIIGIEIDGKNQNISPIIIDAKQAPVLVHYKKYSIPLKKKQRKTYGKGSEIILSWKILGDDMVKQSVVFNRKNNFIEKESGKGTSLPLVVDSNSLIGHLPIGEYVIDTFYQVKSLNKLMIYPGTKFIFKNEGRLIVDCNVYFKGTEENPVRLLCDESFRGKGVRINPITKGICKFDYCSFQNHSEHGMFQLRSTSANINHCTFSGESTGSVFEAYDCKLSIGVLFLNNINSKGIVVQDCDVTVNRMIFNEAQEEAWQFNYCSTRINQITTNNATPVISINGGGIATTKELINSMILNHHPIKSIL